MKEELITFKTAQLAKEKGLDLNQLTGVIPIYKENETLGMFSSEAHEYYCKQEEYLQKWWLDSYLAPTQSLLQRWLREVHNIRLIIETNSHNDLWQYVIKWYDKYNNEIYGNGSKTYEEAFEKGLFEALKLI